MSTPVSDLDELSAELTGYWNDVVAFVLNRRARASIYSGRAAELSPVKLQAVLALSPVELRMGELAARLGLAESTVTRLVEGLEGLGLVERAMPGGDRRSVVVGLREEGRRVVQEVYEGRRGFLGEILAALEPEEQREMVRLFGKLSGVLRDQPAGRERIRA